VWNVTLDSTFLKRNCSLPKTKAEKAEAARERRLRTCFNICSEEYEKVLLFQGGNCAITGQPSALLVMDHDHTYGLLRGLVDWKLNKGLELFRDDPVLLRRAADYLENPTVTRALGEPVYGLVGRINKMAKNRRYGPNKTKTPQPRTAIQGKPTLHTNPKKDL